MALMHSLRELHFLLCYHVDQKLQQAMAFRAKTVLQNLKTLHASPSVSIDSILASSPNLRYLRLPFHTDDMSHFVADVTPNVLSTSRLTARALGENSNIYGVGPYCRLFLPA